MSIPLAVGHAQFFSTLLTLMITCLLLISWIFMPVPTTDIAYNVDECTVEATPDETDCPEDFLYL